MLTDLFVTALLNSTRNNPMLAQSVVNLLVPRMIEAVKRWKHMRGINQQSDGRNKWLSFLSAALVSAGFTFKFSITGSAAEGWEWSLGGFVPPLELLFEFVFRLIYGGGLQQMAYKSSVKGREGILRTVGGGIAHTTASALAAVGLARKKDPAE